VRIELVDDITIIKKGYLPMSNSEVNPYEAPGADLRAGNSTDKGITNFKRFTAWGVFGLTIITLGIYPLYWVISRALKNNSFNTEKIGTVWILGLLVGAALSFLLQIYSIVSPSIMTESSFVTAYSVVTVVYIVFYLVTLFKLRNRIRDLSGLKVSGILTFFGSAIYLQYKTNQAIDQSSA